VGDGATRGDLGRTAIDFEDMFRAVPAPCVVLDRDLVIVDVNAAHEQISGRRREDLIGRGLFEAYPENDSVAAIGGEATLRASIARVLATERPDVLPPQKYDVRDGAGGFVERWWSPVHVPVHDRDGRLLGVLQRAEDITDHVGPGDLALRQRLEEAQAELLVRDGEVRHALHAQAVANRQIAALSDVAPRLAGAETVDDLVAVVVQRGLAVLDGAGGAVAVRSDALPGATGDVVLRVTMSRSLDAAGSATGRELALDAPLPACEAATTGQRVLLADRGASVAYSAAMAEVVTRSGLEAWACLPLVVQGRCLGSLNVAWSSSQRFTAREVELLDALAAQCAQALDRVLAHQVEREAATQMSHLAEALQRSLLTPPLQRDGVEIAVRYLPAMAQAHVGGDWYDAFPLPDGATALAIGDVGGHDRDAAAAMAQVRNLLRGIAYALGEPPAAVLSALDRALRGLDVDVLVTTCMGRLEDPGGGAPGRRFVWSCAGHPPPLVVHAGAGAELLDRDPDLLLGLHPGTGRRDHTVDLAPGDVLVLFTDGLVERRSVDLASGLEALCRTAADLGPLPAEHLADALLVELAAEPEDDVALVVARVR
jgi:PAS domain S-box-containing protein